MNHLEDVKDCISFNETKKSYKCDRRVLDDFETGERYNCVKGGRCTFYKSVEQHLKEQKESKDRWERETYERLKKKFEKKAS